MTKREMKLREEYFDGPASDSMSLMQYFLSKGFAKLPESVQKKIDPKLAKKV